MNLFNQTTLGADAIEITDQQHPQHQFRIDRRATSVAIEIGQFHADRVKIQQPVDLAKQVVLRNMTLDPKAVKQVLLCLQPSHHCLILLSLKMIESDDELPIQVRFSGRQNSA